jgi:hypothetical protein
MSAQPIQRAGATGDAADAPQQFFAAVAKQANQAIAPIYHTEISTIQYPTQGDFNWNWQNISQVFNNATFNYISAAVSGSDTPGTVQLSPGGGFPNEYVRLINALSFTLSAADQATLNAAELAAATQAAAVVSTYQGIFGQITPSQMEKAQTAVPAVTNSLDYVISYVLGVLWSGATPPLTWQAMQEAKNLKKLLPNLPASGESVLGAVQTYLNALGPADSLQDQLDLGSWILNQLKNNTGEPTAANGGMTTVDPNTGAILPVQVGYGINSPVTAIQNDLNNQQRVFEVSLGISESAGGQLSVSIDEASTFIIPSVLAYVEQTSNQYDLNTFAGTSANAQITISYQGFTMVPVAPTAWQQATKLGWYYGAPIAEAWQNWQQGTNPTGFNFVSDPTTLLGEDGRGLGQITNLLISNYPTLSITYSDADYASFSEAWNESTTGNLLLFGFIPLGSFSEGVYQSSSVSTGSNSSFTLTFAPSPQVLTVPALQQTAYVVGGTFDYPATDSPTVVEQLLRLVK